MSKSRLEKFLYALYSLDSSDLPSPLSRIEELYKCLVTGEEAPSFEPISRVEKYLMAILGGYDVNELPNPISRVEVLLYKLAIGDDNLDDVKSFLSEHEELLAEIIRNGGVRGNIDIEYVLHTLSTGYNTLYNTAEKPVKSAILKGNTLVNVNRSNFVVNSDITGDYENAISKFDTDMKASTTYTVIAYSDNQYEYRLSEMRNTTEIALNNVRPLTVGVPTVFTTNEKFTNLRGYLKGDTLNIPQGTEIKILIIEGDHSNENIPYFEGMQSVKMPVLTTSNEDGTKTNILTVNEPVELRGIGEVKDELDLVTGEVTRRISEIVLDGSDDLAYNREAHSNDTTTMVHVPLPNTNRNFDFYNDKLPQKHIYDITNVTEGVFSDWGGLFVRLLNSKLSSPDSNGVKEYLQSKPITVQYQLATESVKTIDISTVDQDGNNTELSTFNDITHVTLSSEGLIPEAELEVATKNEEVLNTMSLKMDDISAAQTTLKETSNTQSENVDATMIATTEIYEGLL